MSLVVTTNSDVTDAFDGLTSLREALTLANNQAGADEITFDPTLFTADVDERTNTEIVLTQGTLVDQR